MKLLAIDGAFLAVGALSYLLTVFRVVQVGPCTDTAGAISLLSVLVASPVGIVCLAVHGIKLLKRN
jgi:hypothetical protein